MAQYLKCEALKHAFSMEAIWFSREEKNDSWWAKNIDIIMGFDPPKVNSPQ